MLEPEIKALLQRQAAWQKQRARLPWGEKLRLALQLREVVCALHRTRTNYSGKRRMLVTEDTENTER